jgi:hypothetical protein
MGAWGYYPKDSDGALDLFGTINDKVNEEIERLSENNQRSYHYDYAGLIMLLCQKGFHIKVKVIKQAKECVEYELSRTIDGNRSGWDDPGRAIKYMEKLSRAFTNLIKRSEKFYLTTKTLGGRNISKHSKAWRIKKFNDSEILAPRYWMKRESFNHKG